VVVYGTVTVPSQQTGEKVFVQRALCTVYYRSVCIETINGRMNRN